jgi:predicted RNase H-like nuclease
VRFVGVDGCRGGWVAATIEGRARRFEILRGFAEIERLGADRVLVDMPIGLPDSGYRASDLAARAMLGPARSRVFLGARRPLLSFADYDAANLWAKRDGKGLSRQLWNILPKIAEIDRFITPRHQSWLLEAHPELAFRRLSGGRVLPGKKTAEGRRLRHEFLAASGFRELDAWLAQLAGSGAGFDDLLDACALALSARRPRRVECPRAVDACGLAMDIWY